MRAKYYIGIDAGTTTGGVFNQINGDYMRAKRVDDNQREIVKQIRRLGITVVHLHTIGKGCPDLLLGFRNKNFLIELKDSQKAASKKKLTDDEQEFFNTWRGQVNKCETIEDILNVVNK